MHSVEGRPRKRQRKSAESILEGLKLVKLPPAPIPELRVERGAFEEFQIKIYAHLDAQEQSNAQRHSEVMAMLNSLLARMDKLGDQTGDPGQRA
jgi:propanediol dehydratase large subunit